PGWSLDFDASLDEVDPATHQGTRIIVREGDLTEHHFSLGAQDGQPVFVPEPYHYFGLEKVGDEYVHIDVLAASRRFFAPDPSRPGRFLLVRELTGFGLERRFERDPTSGRVVRVTDNTLPADQAWLALTWQANAPQLTIRNPAGDAWKYSLNGAGLSVLEA